jgi:hypothetical protein
MGFLLESPVQIVRFSALHLSTRRGALQILVKSSEPFDTSLFVVEEEFVAVYDIEPVARH